jgi:predicted secreted Zn-dependent protease
MGGFAVVAGGSGEVMDVGHVMWRRSSYTGANGNCVEVAQLPAVVAVRDSKDPDGPRLACSPQEWRAFVAGVKAGEFRPGLMRRRYW